jgi:hypothetical protein
MPNDSPPDPLAATRAELKRQLAEAYAERAELEVALNDELATLEKVKRLLEEGRVLAPALADFYSPSTTFLKKAKKLLAELCALPDDSPLRHALEGFLNHRLEMRTGRPGDHTINDSGWLLETARVVEEGIDPWDAAWEVAGKDPRSITNEDVRESIRKRLYRKFKRYGRVWLAVNLVIKGLENKSTRSEVEQILKDYTGSTAITSLMLVDDFPDEYLQKLRLAVSLVSRRDEHTKASQI